MARCSNALPAYSTAPCSDPRWARWATSAHTGQSSVLPSSPFLEQRQDRVLCSLTSSVLSLCASPQILWLSLLGQVGPGPHTLGAVGAVPLSALKPAVLTAQEELKGLETAHLSIMSRRSWWP